MKRIVAVLHNGVLARYGVEKMANSGYQADLLHFAGKDECGPPAHLEFEKFGRHCIGSVEDQDLMDDLCYAADRAFRGGK